LGSLGIAELPLGFKEAKQELGVPSQNIQVSPMGALALVLPGCLSYLPPRLETG